MLKNCQLRLEKPVCLDGILKTFATVFHYTDLPAGKYLTCINDFISFREVFSLMDAMKVDMANFQLQTIKPHLVQQSVEFERKKFKDYLETNPGTNILQFEH